MYRLANPVKDYAWGSLDAIAGLLGVEPSGRPQAELWIGAHPAGTSVAATPGGAISLRDVIAANPDSMLGDRIARRFGSLPFLLKILSAAEPLSLQAHPTKEQAQTGYAAENAAGVPLGAPTRNYKDGNHKPELLLALTPFEALTGFNQPRVSADLLRQLRVRTGPGGVLDDLIADLSRADASAALRAASERLLTLDASAAERLVAEVVGASADIDNASARTAIELDKHYPGDAGVVLSLLLNRVSLAPGEAVFLPAGNLHAYLSGTGVEIMATSDNVLRGGLTGKHIDVPELLAIVDFSAGEPARELPRQVCAGQVDFAPPIEDFRLSVVELGGDHDVRWDDREPRTAIALAGALTLSGGNGSVTLHQGDAVFVAAADAPVIITGSGALVAAAPGG